MALVYVTGIEAAGKSTVCKELQKRGYEAYDIDQDGISAWFNISTGEQFVWPESDLVRNEAWYKDHEYKMIRSSVEQFAKAARSKPIFLCGTTQSDAEVLDLFDVVVYLYLDEATLRRRLAKRTGRGFGGATHELAQILSWHKSSEAAYRERCALMIDATKPIDQVVDRILENYTS
jgi:dephospho-CoA kinase